MAISDRIQAEARRTIDGIQRFYEKYSDEVDDAEEREHRIARVEASMEGCNGLSQEDKIQKTAENVFELTCAQERSYDAIRMELRKMKEQTSKDFKDLQTEIRTGIDGVMKKIEDSGMDSSSSSAGKKVNAKFLTKIISDHPLIAFNAFIFVILLVFVSGHFELLYKLCWGK